MSNNPQDTQFAGFAQALFDAIAPLYKILRSQKYWGELDNAIETEEYIKVYIAQCAYNLVAHAVECLDYKELEYVDCVSDLPDLPELPEAE